MKLDEKGLRFRCDNCGKEEEGRFMGCVDQSFPPRYWISGRNSRHLCSSECLQQYVFRP